MTLQWIHEAPARWDEGKKDIVGGAPTGIFAPGDYDLGGPVPGEWWRVDDDGSTVGYGWMDTGWEGAEILLCVKPDRQTRGVGSFIVDHLEEEAGRRKLEYLFNTVRETHPDREGITRWLEKRGFEGSQDGSLRRRVRKG